MSDQYERDGNFYDDGGWDDGCQECGGEGFVVVCIDDMCRGVGECLHGDGERACPNPKCDAW